MERHVPFAVPLLAASVAQGGQAPAIAPQPTLLAPIEATNRHDVEAFVATFSDDAEVLELATGAVLGRGAADIRAFYGAHFKANPALHTEVIPRLVQGDFIIDQERLTGLLTGPGGSERPPVTAVVVSEIREGLIRRAWIVR